MERHSLRKAYRWLKRCATAVLLFSASGCAWMGTSNASHIVRGNLLDERGQPVANQSIEVSIPSRFRPHGEEAYFQANDSKHNDQLVTLITDYDGSFHHLFPPYPYEIAYYILPPVGKFPRHPKKLTYAIRDGSRAYLVGEERGHFGYRILTPSGRAARDPTQHITGVYTLNDGIWELSLTIRR